MKDENEKTEIYRMLTAQTKSLLDGEDDLICAMANISAAVYSTLPDLNWAGFYRVKDGNLILGPFQGKIACTRIKRGMGVCGTALALNEPQVVPDVHEFPGHIACDSDSRSEIVIPIRDSGGEPAAVLDVDSPLPERFDGTDLDGLSGVCRLIESAMYRN